MSRRPRSHPPTPQHTHAHAWARWHVHPHPLTHSPPARPYTPVRKAPPSKPGRRLRRRLPASTRQDQGAAERATLKERGARPQALPPAARAERSKAAARGRRRLQDECMKSKRTRGEPAAARRAAGAAPVMSQGPVPPAAAALRGRPPSGRGGSPAFRAPRCSRAEGRACTRMMGARARPRLCIGAQNAHARTHESDGTTRREGHSSGPRCCTRLPAAAARPSRREARRAAPRRERLTGSLTVSTFRVARGAMGATPRVASSALAFDVHVMRSGRLVWRGPWIAAGTIHRH